MEAGYAAGVVLYCRVFQVSNSGTQFKDGLDRGVVAHEYSDSPHNKQTIQYKNLQTCKSFTYEECHYQLATNESKIQRGLFRYVCVTAQDQVGHLVLSHTLTPLLFLTPPRIDQVGQSGRLLSFRLGQIVTPV